MVKKYQSSVYYIQKVSSKDSRFSSSPSYANKKDALAIFEKKRGKEDGIYYLVERKERVLKSI